MSLSGTIRRLRNEENDRRAVEQDPEAFVSRWRSDIMKVYELFDHALKPFVSDGAALISRGQTVVVEDALGEYSVATLEIQIVGRRIHVLPIARFTVAGTGRLDLYREDRPSESNRVLMIRGGSDVAHDSETWLIQDRSSEKTAMERAMQSGTYLREARAYRPLNDEAIQDGIDYLLKL